MNSRRYQHPTIGFTIALPAGWELIDDVPGVALIAMEPARDGWFRSNVVVTVEHLAPGTELEQWAVAADGLLERALHRYLWLDDELVEIDGHRTRRTLSHHTMPENQAVTMEQWALVEGCSGYTLTASAGTIAYDVLADVFQEVAARFRADPGYRCLA
jgi:hypothetical protein